jgi:2-polyprenyl-3-methyl-5-hydroxy-6-metoxy-1,4-benzoquinol methylase
MRETLLPHLSCPECQSLFDLTVFHRSGDQITEGLLHCIESRHAYPIVRSIPRVLGSAFEQEPEFTAKHREAISAHRRIGRNSYEPQVEQTKTGFGRQWNTYQVQRPEEDLAYFCSKTGVDPVYLKGKLVLDAGCGSGRYSKIAGEAEATVIGVDLSSAVETAAANTAHLPNVHIIQTDIFRLPFKPQLFQFIYSIGVLHHTPDTKKALFSLIPLLSDTGEIAVWLYERWPAPVELYNRMLRAVTTRMNHDTLHRLAVSMEPIGLLKLNLLTADRWWQRVLGQLLRGMTIGVSYHPDREIRICDTFDWFSPPYQWHHTDEEIESWFREVGLIEIKNLSVGQVHYQHNYGSGVNFKARHVMAESALEQ